MGISAGWRRLNRTATVLCWQFPYPVGRGCGEEPDLQGIREEVRLMAMSQCRYPAGPSATPSRYPQLAAGASGS